MGDWICGAAAAVVLAAAPAWAAAQTAPVPGQPQPKIPSGPPDLIIYDAKIVTVDDGFSIAQAAAVKDGRFTAVGTDAAVLATAGPKRSRST
jgi:hypothetical protein